MSSQRRITIWDVTSSQGSAVLQSLYGNISNSFILRAVLRSPDFEFERQLSQLGVEVYTTDGWDRAHLVRALSDSWGLFVDTSLNEAIAFDNVGTESDLGRAIVEAAAEAQVEHIVYSSLPSLAQATHGEVNIDMFEHKYAIEQLIRNSQACHTCTFVLCGVPLENLMNQVCGSTPGPYRSDSTGVMTITRPAWTAQGDGFCAFLSLEHDFGDIVHGIFLDPKRWNQISIQAFSDIRSWTDHTNAVGQLLEKPVRFVPMQAWRDFETHGDKYMDMLKKICGGSQEAGGRFYGQDFDTFSSPELKHTAALARGSEEEAALTRLEDWVEKRREVCRAQEAQMERITVDWFGWSRYSQRS